MKSLFSRWTDRPLRSKSLVIIALPIWHGMHRIYHGLHDLGIHTTKLHHYVFYGFAFLVSAITVGLLMVLVLQ